MDSYGSQDFQELVTQQNIKSEQAYGDQVYDQDEEYEEQFDDYVETMRKGNNLKELLDEKAKELLQHKEKQLLQIEENQFLRREVSANRLKLKLMQKEDKHQRIQLGEETKKYFNRKASSTTWGFVNSGIKPKKHTMNKKLSTERKSNKKDLAKTMKKNEKLTFPTTTLDASDIDDQTMLIIQDLKRQIEFLRDQNQILEQRLECTTNMINDYKSSKLKLNSIQHSFQNLNQLLQLVQEKRAHLEQENKHLNQLLNQRQAIKRRQQYKMAALQNQKKDDSQREKELEYQRWRIKELEQQVLKHAQLMKQIKPQYKSCQ